MVFFIFGHFFQKNNDKRKITLKYTHKIFKALERKSHSMGTFEIYSKSRCVYPEPVRDALHAGVRIQGLWKITLKYIYIFNNKLYQLVENSTMEYTLHTILYTMFF